MKNKLRNKNGITLIALVITIIVLLILAGVSITMISSQDGILGKATSAKETQEKATELEKVKLAVQASMINENGTVDVDTLNNELGLTGDSKITELPTKIIINGTKYRISKDGTAEEVKPLKTGDKVEYKGEYFYVVGFSTDKTEVNLLAVKNVDTDNNSANYNKQSDSANTVPFDDDSNEYEGSTIQALVNSYVKNTLGLSENKGRLMTWEEVEKFNESSNSDEYIFPSWITTKSFWLGTPYDDAGTASTTVVALLRGDSNNYITMNCDMSDEFGVRPVIEVLRSEFE